MGNTSYKFLISFFSLSLWLIVFINYLGWSGGYVDLTGASWNNDAWQNSYFGFSSVQFAINDYKAVCLDNLFFGVNYFTMNLQALVDAVLFHIPTFIAGLADGVNWTDILTGLGLIIELFVQPIEILSYIILLLVYVLWYAVGLIAVLLKAFSGQYNVPLSDMPPMPISQVVDTLRITVPVLI